MHNHAFAGAFSPFEFIESAVIHREAVEPCNAQPASGSVVPSNEVRVPTPRGDRSNATMFVVTTVVNDGCRLVG